MANRQLGLGAVLANNTCDKCAIAAGQYVILCPLHAAAEEMRKVLQEIDDESATLQEATLWNYQLNKIRALLAKMEKQDEPRKPV